MVLGSLLQHTNWYGPEHAKVSAVWGALKITGVNVKGEG